MVVKKMVVEMVWTFDSDQCALGYCVLGTVAHAMWS